MFFTNTSYVPKWREHNGHGACPHKQRESDGEVLCVCSWVDLPIEAGEVTYALERQT